MIKTKAIYSKLTSSSFCYLKYHSQTKLFVSRQSFVASPNFWCHKWNLSQLLRTEYLPLGLEQSTRTTQPAWKSLKLSTSTLRGVAVYKKRDMASCQEGVASAYQKMKLTTTKKRGMSGKRDGTIMADMLPMLMEDRQRWEAELAEERWFWEERLRRAREYEEERLWQQVKMQQA